MVSINAYQYLVATLRGKKYEFGSLSSPTVLTAAGDDIYEVTKTVAVSTAVTLWDPADSAMSVSDFDVLVLATDFDLEWEFTVDVGGEVGTRLQTGEILGSGTAGTYGYPLIMTSDDAYGSNYTAGWAAPVPNTTDVIDKIMVKNQSATNAAQVILLLFT